MVKKNKSRQVDLFTTQWTLRLQKRKKQCKRIMRKNLLPSFNTQEWNLIERNEKQTLVVFSITKSFVLSCQAFERVCGWSSVNIFFNNRDRKTVIYPWKTERFKPWQDHQHPHFSTKAGQLGVHITVKCSLANKIDGENVKKKLSKPTLLLHHSVMQFQQNKWPQGVAVLSCSLSRHRAHLMPIAGRVVDSKGNWLADGARYSEGFLDFIN